MGDFALLPPPPSAPDVETALGDHPIVLELAIDLSGDHAVDTPRVELAFHTLALALSGLVVHLKVPDRTGGREWVLVPEDRTKTEPLWRSIYAQTDYWVTEPQDESIPGRRESFSPLDNLEPLPVLALPEYQSRRGISADETLTIPDTLGESLDRLGALDESRQDQFLRACFWLNHAARVWSMSHSASYAATAQAVEALLPPAKGVFCSACQRSHDEPSIGQRFNAWVQSNVPDEEQRSGLYRLRSNVIHGARLLAFDLRFSWGLDPVATAERSSQDLMWRAARIGLANWLLAQ
jgi:hypothetical protein